MNLMENSSLYSKEAMLENEYYKISVIGLGKLGSPMAATIANAGHTVIGLDLNSHFVNELNNHSAPVQEPKLQEFIDGASDRLSATNDYVEAIAKTDITFIIVPTPSMDNGLFTNDYVVEAIRSIGAEIAKKSSYHLVVVSSTVIPGSMDDVIAPALEASSGRCLKDGTIGLCYNPEFIALGSVIENMLYPDITLIGESDSFAGDLLEKIHSTVVKNKPATHRMNFVNAELTKISVNTYVTTKISYANMLAEICDNLPEADSDIVTNAIGSDSRIGKKYIKGAIGYGGPCFPRDNRAFSALGEKIGVNCELASATDLINDRQIDRMINIVNKVSQIGQTVAILGLSYKTDTSEIEDSQGISLARQLSSAGYKVTCFDPLANNNAAAILDQSITVANTIEQALQNAATVIIVTPWTDFKDAYLMMTPNSTLIDPWRLCSDNVTESEIVYIAMGKGTLKA